MYETLGTLLTDYGSIFILRHGQTTPNSLGYWYNDDEEPLNETGISQAREISGVIEKIQPEIFYVSPLRRCIQTSELVLERVNPRDYVVMPELAERNLKPLKGLDSKGIMEKYGIEMDNPITGRIDHLPEAETSEQFRARVKRVFDFILEESQGKRVLVVTHGGVMWAFLQIYLHMDRIKSKTFQNCALLGMKRDGENFTPTISVNMREDWFSDFNPSWKGFQL